MTIDISSKDISKAETDNESIRKSFVMIDAWQSKRRRLNQKDFHRDIAQIKGKHRGTHE